LNFALSFLFLHFDFLFASPIRYTPSAKIGNRNSAIDNLPIRYTLYAIHYLQFQSNTHPLFTKYGKKQNFLQLPLLFIF